MLSKSVSGLAGLQNCRLSSSFPFPRAGVGTGSVLAGLFHRRRWRSFGNLSQIELNVLLFVL